MEIIKLNPHKLSASDRPVSPTNNLNSPLIETTLGLKITDIKQAVKNHNRANIFVNGKYSFSLDISQLATFKIRVGQTITQAELTNFKHASVFGKFYQRTLEWVLLRPRSVKETRDYLFRKSQTQATSNRAFKTSAPAPSLAPSDHEEIIQQLLAKGYLNDETFAAYYIENRFVKKGISKKRLELELRKKGINSNLIERVLRASSRDDAAEIKKIITKKRARYDDEKLIAYLVRQGFDFYLAKELVANGEN